MNCERPIWITGVIFVRTEGEPRWHIRRSKTDITTLCGARVAYAKIRHPLREETEEPQLASDLCPECYDRAARFAESLSSAKRLIRAFIKCGNPEQRKAACENRKEQE